MTVIPAMRTLLGEAKPPVDLNLLVKLPRFEFIAGFLEMATRKKEGRALTQGYQVKRKGKNWQVIQTLVAGGTIAYETDDAGKLYDYVRRGPLNYFIRHAEDMRTDALSKPGG